MLLVGSPIAIATSRGAYADAVIAAGPVAYWRLGETSGTTAADSSGNGRAGTYIGGVTLGQAGALSDGNKAASFDGVDDVVDVTNAAVRLAGELTVEAWINPAIVNTGSDSTIARCGIGSDLMWWLALRADGALQSGHYDGAAFQIVATAGGVITTGQWRHVVVTRAADGKTYKFYVDGALVSSSATTTTPVAAGAQTTQIGKSATQQFNGALDEVAIYARALTAAEIADHYAARTDRYNVTIAGVYRDIQPGFSISETANGRNRLDCAVLSTNGSYRAALEDEVILTEDGTRIMGGVIDRPVESGFGDTGATTAIVQRISAADFNVYPSRVRITADIAAGTMKAALQVVANALAAQGVTLDPAQVAGPALPALSYEDKPAIDVLNEITALASGSAATSYVWEVDYTKTLRAFEAGTLAAPFNVTDGDGNLQGDIVVEQPRTSAYANYILLYGGTGQRDVIDQFVANGVTATFQLGYTLAAGRGYVNVGGTVSGGVISGGVNETFPGTWTYNATTNQITRTSPPPAGAVNLPYTAQFPRAVIADGGLPAAQRVARTYKAEDTFDKDVLQALANSYLARDMASPKTVRYTAAYAKTGLHPGQVQTITSTKRNLSGTFLITDVRIVHVGGSLVRREVTAVSTTRLPKTLRESFQQTFGGSGSTSAAAGTVTVVSSGGVGGSGTAGKLAKWATSATLGDSILSESGSTVTVAGTLAATTFSGSGASLTSLPAAQLTGTIPAATLTGRSLADLGTRSAADLSSGTLAYARMPSGAGTWTATPTISGAVILQDTLAVTGASTLTGTVTVGGTITTPVTTDLTLSPTGVIVAAKSIIPAATDTYDLGRFDRLWNQSYISQMNALVFARTTQTLFGGYSSIGKNAGAFAADVASAATTIDFGQAMTPNDFVLVRAHDTGGTIKAEYLQVGTLVSGTTYNVTRDLAAAHVTDPAWASGTPYLVLGTTNDGRIDLFAYDGKPRIVFTQQGATYNAQSDRGILGNLNSYFGYATDVYGAAFGDASAANITIDPTNGFRVRQGTTTYAQLASSVFTVGNPSGKRIGWDGTNLTVVSDYVTLDNTGIALAPDTTGLFVTTNAYRWSVSHGWMGIGGSDTAGGNRVITIDAFNDTYTAGRDSYVQLLARTKNSSSNQVQAGIVLRAPASGTATVAVDSALVQATGAYIYPGSASGLSANQITYYLASHASWGLYTNSGMYAAGAFTAASGFNVDTNGSAYTVKNAAGTGYLSALTVDGSNLTTIFCNSARLRFVTPSTGASCSGASLGALNVVVDGVGNVRIPYY